MANWEKKSAHLLREIVKFRTYMDSLGAAAAARDRVYRDRDARDELLPAAASAPDPLERAADADGPQDPSDDARRGEGAEVEPQGRGAERGVEAEEH